MSVAELALAKASFVATFISADPSPQARDSADNFLETLTATMNQCSRANVQKCKRWILANISTNGPCIAALAKYLTAISGSTNTSNSLNPVSSSSKPISPRRLRLHILYIISDVLYQTTHHARDPTFAGCVRDHLSRLVQNAAAFPDSPKQTQKIQDLLKIWEQNSYYEPAFSESLKKTAKEAVLIPQAKLKESPVLTAAPDAETPWVLPSTHGDPTTPWYDLPAANWLPLMEPNSTRPMNPEMLRPLQMNCGPADQGLIDTVKRILAISDQIYSKEGSRADKNFTVNEMGQRVEVDEITGDVLDGETYYGWSRGFCRKMKERQKKLQAGTPLDYRRSSPSRSRSRSRSSSRPAFKRRKLSQSPRNPGRTGGRSRSRGRSRSSYDSYSRSPTPDRSRSYRRRRSRSASSERSRSRSGDYQRDRRRAYSRSRSRSPKGPQQYGNGHLRRDYDNERSRLRSPSHRASDHDQHPPLPPSYGNQPFNQAGIPPPPPPLNSGFPPNIPPPPPPGGQFPPPGMPPLPLMPNQLGQFPNFAGVPPPPPPPPAGQYQGHQQWSPVPHQSHIGQGYPGAPGWYGTGLGPQQQQSGALGSNHWGMQQSQGGHQGSPPYHRGGYRGRGGGYRGRGGR